MSDQNSTPDGRDPRLLSMAEVLEKVPFSRASLYRLMRLGQFPQAVKCGTSRVGFHAYEIEIWMKTRPRTGREPS